MHTDEMLDRLLAYAGIEARLDYLANEADERDEFYDAEAFRFACTAIRDEIAKMRKPLTDEPTSPKPPAKASFFCARCRVTYVKDGLCAFCQGHLVPS